MEFLAALGLFAAKTVLIVASILIVLIFALQMGTGRVRQRNLIEVEKLNARFRAFRRSLQGHLMGKKQFKSLMRSEKKARKGASEPKSKRVFVLDFDGDIRASQVQSLREEVTALLSVATTEDEVVVRLESGGGMVTSYGLAASQLARFRSRQIPLTICADKIAASGGYMMACVADRILAAPFAVVGSIGVVAQVPNFNRLLRRNNIDYNEVTAGEFKRTVSIFGEITEPGLEKFKSQIEETHTLFKSFVSANRPRVDIARVATGEHWYGTQALELGLIDELLTSDDYLVSKFEDYEVLRLEYHGRKKLSERLSDSFSRLGASILGRLWTEIERGRLG